LAVTATFKKAVLDHYGRLFGDDPDHQSAPPVLTGHGFTRPGYHQAYWLALPDVGQPHADGRLHGLAICLPAGSDALLLEPLRTALAGLRELVLPGGRRIDVRSFAGERRPLAANPARWLGPSRRWVSALPVVHERRRRHGPTLSDAVEWCRHAGFPDPVGFRTSPVPLIPGAVVLAPAETRRAGHEGRPFSHIELEFSLEVTGPVVLGRGRQFGLGLCAPVPESGSHGKPMPGADVTGD
jgi:CRISPR-associated protein Csb2